MKTPFSKLTQEMIRREESGISELDRLREINAELLSALKTLVDHYTAGGIQGHDIPNALAAINKAERKL